jgi:hypothetical protein
MQLASVQIGTAKRQAGAMAPAIGDTKSAAVEEQLTVVGTRKQQRLQREISYPRT